MQSRRAARRNGVILYQRRSPEVSDVGLSRWLAGERGDVVARTGRPGRLPAPIGGTGKQGGLRALTFDEPPGPTEMSILAQLEDRQRHGYDIGRQSEGRSDGARIVSMDVGCLS